MITNEEQKRLKKEYKVIRGTYTIRMHNDCSFEDMEKNMSKWFEYWGERLEDHTVRGGWKERK